MHCATLGSIALVSFRLSPSLRLLPSGSPFPFLFFSQLRTSSRFPPPSTGSFVSCKRLRRGGGGRPVKRRKGLHGILPRWSLPRPVLGPRRWRGGTSASAYRKTRGSPTLAYTGDPKAPRSLERENSSKIVPSPAQQEQAQEELKKARKESRAPEELNVMEPALGHGREGGEAPAGRIKALEGEIRKAKESERKMLESLVLQTKQLGQAKMELEEAKLEVRNLQKSFRGLENARNPSTRNLLRVLEKPTPSDSSQSQEEVKRLKDELRLATEAEEKSNKAMDSLALALKEVTTELNQVKDKLATTQSELQTALAEADHLKSKLKAKEENFRIVLAEVEHLRLEAEESAAAWSAKEEGFISCIRASEEEAAKAMQENRGLLESQQEAREENSRLRDIMKQALNEANVVKTGLEIARRENSQLKLLLSEKEKSLETIKQEYECLKGSETASLESAQDPESLTATERSRSARSLGSESFTKSETVLVRQGTRRNVMAEFRSERWGNDDPRIQNVSRAPEARTGSFGSVGVGSSGRRNRMPGSVGCASKMRFPSFLSLSSCKALSFDGFCHVQKVDLDGRSNGSGSSAKQKRKQILKKFDDLLRRKSLHNYERVTTAGSLTL